MSSLNRSPLPWPAWVPPGARLYLRHTEDGLPIRQLAREEGCAPSTVLRRIRRIESRRDDPLFDEALGALARRRARKALVCPNPKGDPVMSAHARREMPRIDEETLTREARRILRRLAEPNAGLLVAPDLDKAVVLRGTVRTAVMDRAVAQAFALKDWITAVQSGRVTRYEISTAGRAALKRFLEADALARNPGFAEAQAHFEGGFAGQHRVWGMRDIPDEAGRPPRRLRANLAESPLSVLARRRDKEGRPFLSPELVAAGERLREDFELAQMGPRVAQNWERFLTAGERGCYRPEATGGGAERARERVAAALRDLGPGLGDMVLRCCCFLEGLETAEKRLGWSARSGKIVLRIALERLKRHYDDTYGGASPLIG
ncbi:DUF6456 domain-containing protein [Phaeovulum vinaykumarii]|uniref:DUF6456 domain-containing protein n=1 Tax=Phaeovulum vinaykumarii TaxID=407234 RepID=A0A1N7LV72_9RHOB|nr:DUF6456 domain-containing protein [Phaeovulum vinaykumarii]SIS77747.1 hypothetical protein SAMN05421795_104160 [Phaeovulum vinaykumarii]SOC07316.1 hypothetical protein SAMN05878426_10494 [Phaeovulum vinaykumarii]